MDTISETRLAVVWPTLAGKTRALADALAAKGIYIRVVQGLRTVAEQDALFAQGRTTPGPRVTNVRGGYSWHNYGLAVDCVPSIEGPDAPFTPNWDSDAPSYPTMWEAARLLGLTCGADWTSFPDPPHLQLTGQYPPSGPNSVVRQLAIQGLPPFWSTINLP